MQEAAAAFQIPGDPKDTIHLKNRSKWSDVLNNLRNNKIKDEDDEVDEKNFPVQEVLTFDFPRKPTANRK